MTPEEQALAALLVYWNSLSGGFVWDDRFQTSCLRFAGRVTHVRRKTRFRPLVKRYRTGFPPAGLLRKVSDLYSTFHPPFPRLLSAIRHAEETSI